LRGASHALYVYSRAAIEGAYAESRKRCADAIRCLCYSSGKFESGGARLADAPGRGLRHRFWSELARVLAAGGDPRKTLSRVSARPKMKSGWRSKRTFIASIWSPQPSWSAWLRWRESWGDAHRWAFRVNPDVDARSIPTSHRAAREQVRRCYRDAERLYAKAAAMPRSK